MSSTPSARGALGGLPEYAPGEILVKFRRGATVQRKNGLLARIRGRLRQSLSTTAMREVGEPGVERIVTSLGVLVAIRALRQDPWVEFAEPNWRYTTQEANDPGYTNGSLWGMYGATTTPANAFGSRAGEAWAVGYTGSPSVYVGVIDEGVQYDHPDLAANVWTNPFDPVDGVDNDGNGYVDDIHGWDFFHGDNSVHDPGEDSHGTHVAGTIGAVGNNSVGVVGVNWTVKMIPAKFLGPNGGYTSGAIEAINYLVDLKSRHGLNVVATNSSWGGGEYSQALHQAIIRAAKANILFIAAAGNSAGNNDATPQYPANYSTTVAAGSEPAASYESVVSVAAIDNAGNLASFSSYGGNTVDLGAPGVSIYSTIPGSYGYKSGTSMATPHVTGAAALYASANVTARGLEIRTAILGNAVPTASLAGKTATGGRLSVGGSFFSGTAPPPPAGALRINCGGPSYVSPTIGTFQADAYSSGGNVWDYGTVTGGTSDPTLYRTVRWGNSFGYNLPVTNGDYTLKLHFAEGYWWAPGQRVFNVAVNGTMVLANFDIVQAAGGGRVAVVRSVPVSATTGTVSVSFQSVVGAPIISAIELISTGPVGPPSAPSPPGGVSATAGSGQIALSWNASGGASAYNVKRGATAGGPYPTVATGVTATSYTDTGLTNGTTYYYVVTAVNQVGESGPSSEVSATPQAVVRINCGGPAYVSPTRGAFQADTYSSGGDVWDYGTVTGGTTDPTLYRTVRWGNSFSYNLPAPNGSHTLKLHFAEGYWWSPGQRVFNVAVNGTTVLANFDIVAQAGGGKVALVKSFPVTSTGTVTVSFQSVVGAPIVSAIELVPVTP